MNSTPPYPLVAEMISEMKYPEKPHYSNHQCGRSGAQQGLPPSIQYIAF
jgi:hypothetical protein